MMKIISFFTGMDVLHKPLVCDLFGVPYMFTAAEMLEKKELRGRPSQAQLYFRTLMRDAAEKAGIWNQAPKLSTITATERGAFFKAIESCAPELLTMRRLLWTKLGESLSNRRKYLMDKEKGKRSSNPYQ